jgi:DNA mismatch repair protein MutL
MARKTIEQLSPAVINKIAAGEVIERPASVVKELVENSIDAGATQIDVSVQQGGAELIRVVDNGHGIPADELLLAVASHATSKIRDADDLFRVGTMGFRGEALASIAEVSEFRLRSRIGDSHAGAELEIVGGKASPVEPCGCSVGTTIEVKRLFFNTPVRRKFMRTPQTEMGHASEAMTRIALAHPGVRFALHNGTRKTLDLPPVRDLRERIASCFGGELAQDLIWVESQDECARISGYVGNPRHSRSTNKQQYLFLNGRHIRDRALQHALSEAYRGILLTGRFPITFLNLEIPPETVDVNVHPTKLEVRFQDGGRLYKQLLGMLRNRFLTTDLTATFAPGPAGDEQRDEQQRADTPHAPTRAPLPSAEFKPFPSDNSRRDEILSWARGQQRSDDDFALRAPTMETQQSLALSPTDVPRPAPREPATDAMPREQSAVGSSNAMQVHNRYLVTASDDGIVVIDQHALHERVIYEQLREKVLQKAVEKQRLLVPEPVQLSPTEAAAVLQSQELLSDLGIDVEDFGGDSVLVSSYPAMLANFSPSELIRQLAEQLSTGTKLPDSRDLLDEILHMISCKAAIKAGDRLAPAEIESLIEQRHLVQDSHHCPHGRPTTLIFTQKELDKRFQRT